MKVQKEYNASIKNTVLAHCASSPVCFAFQGIENRMQVECVPRRQNPLFDLAIRYFCFMTTYLGPGHYPSSQRRYYIYSLLAYNSLHRYLSLDIRATVAKIHTKIKLQFCSGLGYSFSFVENIFPLLFLCLFQLITQKL